MRGWTDRGSGYYQLPAREGDGMCRREVRVVSIIRQDVHEGGKESRLADDVEETERRLAGCREHRMWISGLGCESACQRKGGRTAVLQGMTDDISSTKGISPH